MTCEIRLHSSCATSSLLIPKITLSEHTMCIKLKLCLNSVVNKLKETADIGRQSIIAHLALPPVIQCLIP